MLQLALCFKNINDGVLVVVVDDEEELVERYENTHIPFNVA